jgi:hypothetical protein
MSNPTELPDLDVQLDELLVELVSAWSKSSIESTKKRIRELFARRAQPEGEASDIDEEAERTSATDRAFPITDSPHASVQQRTAESRAAFGFGWDARAELSKLDWQQGYADALDLHELGPKELEGEAPQADLLPSIQHNMAMLKRNVQESIAQRDAATLSPLCGAQHAEATWECRRYCKGDGEWTEWRAIGADEYERRKDDSAFEFRARAAQLDGGQEGSD